MSNKQADQAYADERTIWYGDGQSPLKEARIYTKPRGGDRSAWIALLDGETLDAPLEQLHLENPGQGQAPVVAPPGMKTLGPSRPVKGQNPIHRGLTETEQVGGKDYVRVYSALMGSVPFSESDTTTGVGKSKYKDIHQDKATGKVVISSGQNKMLWAGLGRPLRTLKWTEKYFAQILDEKPELKTTYDDYVKTVDKIELQKKRMEQLEGDRQKWEARIRGNQRAWSKRGGALTKRQSNSLAQDEKKRDAAIQSAKLTAKAIKASERKVAGYLKTLGAEANPVIRTFLVPIETYESISSRAVPEELNTVFSQGESAKEALDAMREIQGLIDLRDREALKEGKADREARRLSGIKNKNKRLVKRQALRTRQAEDARKRRREYEKKIFAAFAKYDKKKDDKGGKEPAFEEVRGAVDARAKKERKELDNLAKKAMPDLDVSDLSPESIVDRLRDFETRSINVDRHYEPNQFGVKGPDLDLLREDALPGSLKTYALFPGNMPKERRRESGEVEHVNVLREKLGIPEQNLSDSPWLSGSDFAKQKKFKGEADKLSLYYATWVETRSPGFNTEALIEPKYAKIPLERRREMLEEFLAENKVAPHEKNSFMEKVVAPWASQSMIAHVMAEDYDRMGKDEDVGPEVTGQDFTKMRRDLPTRRADLRKTGKEIDQMVGDNESPKKMIDKLIERFPELEGRFSKISAKSEGYTFYEHAQMVYQQFMKLAEDDSDEGRLLPKALMGKMILFHDMEKWNSKSQYGREGEHRLTVDEMRKYKELWGDKDSAKKAELMVDSDPFGEYLKGKTTREEAKEEIESVAKRLGFKPQQYRQFFREYLQFFQADFSSYTSKVGYSTMGGEERVGKPVMDRFFRFGGDNDFERKDTGAASGRFKFSAAENAKGQAYEARFSELEELFD